MFCTIGWTSDFLLSFFMRYDMLPAVLICLAPARPPGFVRLSGRFAAEQTSSHDHTLMQDDGYD